MPLRDAVAHQLIRGAIMAMIQVQKMSRWCGGGDFDPNLLANLIHTTMRKQPSRLFGDEAARQATLPLTNYVIGL